jgi:hypothetical protein
VVSFSQFSEVASTLGLLCSTAEAVYQFEQIMGWATFWAIFLQTHLVTLRTIKHSCFLLGIRFALFYLGIFLT